LFQDRGAQILATLYQLDQSQWWSRERLADSQASQLRALLRHAQATAPYYRERLDDLDLSGDPEQLLADWTKLPLLTRAAAQQAGTALYSSAVPKSHGKTTLAATSGSTGMPLEVLSTQLIRHINLALNLREDFWHGRDTSAKNVSIRPDRGKTDSGGADKPHWDTAHSLIANTGPSARLHSSVAIDKQVDWLLQQQPVYLLSMPNNLKGIAEEMRARGETLPDLREIRSYAETLTVDIRQLLGEVFAVPVTDVYSAVEIGYIGLQCPEHEHFHIQSESVLLEVLDEADQACQPGQVGRVVITALHNFASPLIRYEIGDYVELGEPCACGRGLPVINRVMGRERNLITLPDGSRHWPSLLIRDWSLIAPIHQAQVVQKTVHDLEVRLIAARALKPAEESELREFLSKQLHHQFNYQISYHKSLKRGRHGKFEDFISELERS
jgi:phenylacetate-CoA ligase